MLEAPQRGMRWASCEYGQCFCGSPQGRLGTLTGRGWLTLGSSGCSWPASCMWPGGEVDFAGERQPTAPGGSCGGAGPSLRESVGWRMRTQVWGAHLPAHLAWSKSWNLCPLASHLPASAQGIVRPFGPALDRRGPWVSLLPKGRG